MSAASSSSAAISPSLAQLRAFEASLHLTPGHLPITPVSSSEDARQYRIITLPNRLTALIISDPTTDKAAASMNVNVGSFAEPDDVAGLAHFLEHLLFMGTVKYPDEQTYSLSINNAGGSQNAYTTREATNYIFDVAAAHLETILDMFAQFFVAPLCLRSAVDRELNAVNNEHEKNIQEDYWRINQLAESAFNPAHPIARFSTGNFLTLRDEPAAAGIDTRERLLTFYKDHYSANLMKLCVIGKDSLDTLEKWVTNSFSDVPNTNRDRPDFTSIPIALPAQLSTITRIVPVKQYRSLELEFVFPPMHHLYLADPARIFTHCLATEAEGSLAAHLKSLSLVNELHVSGDLELNSSYALGKMDFELTESGLTRIDDILEITFAYIKMLSASLRSTPEVWQNDIYNEVKAVAIMNHRFKEKNEAVITCEDLASRMASIPAVHVISGGLFAEYNHQAVIDVATIFEDVHNCRVRIVAPEYKSLSGLTKEKWYGTEHTVERMSDSLMARCITPATIESFRIPEANKFVATDFALKQPKRTEAEKAASMNLAPKRISCCSSSSSAHRHQPAELFYVADRTFELPKNEITIQIASNVTMQSALTKSIADLWSSLVDDALAELNHYASEAGLGSFSWPAPNGLMLKYTGYNHKLTEFAQTLLPKLVSMRVVGGREAQFARLKEAYARKLLAYASETPMTHARDQAAMARSDVCFSVADQLLTFDSITPADIDRFAESWTKSAKIYVAINGNMDESEAITFTESIQNIFPVGTATPSSQFINRCVAIDVDRTYIRQVLSSNAEDSNSACLNIYQIGTDFEVNAHAMLFSHILGDALFDQLRTKEALGYLVHGYISRSSNVLHYQVAVQSSEAPADYLNHRIEAFMAWFRSTQLGALISETPDFLDKNKAAVILQLTEKDKGLHDEHARMWSEIDRRRYDWDRPARLAAVVATITLESFLAFFDRYFTLSTPIGQSSRRKMSFQVSSHAHTLPSRAECDTAERVEFANVRRPVVPNAATASDSADAASAATAAAAPAVVEEFFLPIAPVDTRKIVYMDDLILFKQSCAMHPAML